MESIETLAIGYKAGTPEKNCGICVYHTVNKATGLFCVLNDVGTKLNGFCGMFGSGKSKETAIINNLELF